MALLTPNATYKMHGVTINEKIIPDGTRWKDATKAKKAGFSAGSLYKKQQKLSGGTGKAKKVTVHNTEDLKNVYDDGEQYTRATYNENMGSARVHLYVDDVCAWQNLKAGTGACSADPLGSAEVSWHAGDGSVADGGNMTSLSIEIIMNDNAQHDAKAKDNGARVAAWLLWKHKLTIDDLVTHTYWVNKSKGITFSDVDKQCTNLISGEKWCPYYIFGSTNETTALKNWKAFKALVKKYLDELNGVKPKDDTTVKTSIEKGDIVSVASNAVYYHGKDVPDFVVKRKWIVKSVAGDRAVIDKSVDGEYSINSPINTKYLTKEKTAAAFKPYTVKVTASVLNIRKGAGTNYAVVGQIKGEELKYSYTIVEEKDGKGATKWGLLKAYETNRNGWISLDYVKRV